MAPLSDGFSGSMTVAHAHGMPFAALSYSVTKPRDTNTQATVMEVKSSAEAVGGSPSLQPVSVPLVFEGAPFLRTLQGRGFWFGGVHCDR